MHCARAQYASTPTKELGQKIISEEDPDNDLDQKPIRTKGGQISAGMNGVKRLIAVDQKPIGRTPRSNLATYTGLFDNIRWKKL